MKGLLLKDWYLMKAHCRMYLIMAAVFLAWSAINRENFFYVLYPCLLCGMIPVNLLAYDERSRWLQYSTALPYTRAQLVSAKYLTGLLVQLAVLAVTAVTQTAGMVLRGSFELQELAAVLGLLLSVTLLGSSLCLPFVFKLGTEKGRMAYYIMVGFICAVGTVALKLHSGSLNGEVRPGWPLAALTAAGIGVYALSWRLSIRFFEKREL